jgi:hypothetical protein
MDTNSTMSTTSRRIVTIPMMGMKLVEIPIFTGLIPVQPPCDMILPALSSTKHTDPVPQNWLKLTPTPILAAVAEMFTPAITHKQPSAPEGPPQPEQTLLKLIPPGTVLLAIVTTALSITQIFCGQVMKAPVG